MGGGWPAITRWVLDPGVHRFDLTRPDGAPIEVMAVVGRHKGPRLVFTAGVHGDEFEGIRALGELAQELVHREICGTVVLIPVSNPEAVAAGSRTSPLDGGNLNRTFPGRPDGTPTEQLAHLLMEQVIRGADLLVDLHAGGTHYAFEVLAGYRELEGPVGAATYRAARSLGLPNLWVMNPNPGVFSYEACRVGVPAVGVEVTGTGGCRERDVALIKRGLYGVLAEFGVLPGAVVPEPDESRRVLRGAWTHAPATGLFRAYVGLGDEVRQGALIAEVLDHWGRPTAALKAAHEGIVAAIRHTGWIHNGDWAVWLMSAEAVTSE